MPHIHGCAWIEQTWLDEHYEIKNGKILDNEEGAIELIDNLISCDIPEDDEELKEYVTKLQTHKHTQ